METALIGLSIFLLILVGVLFFVIFRLQFKSTGTGEINENNIIQKTTHSLFFSPEGRLMSQSNTSQSENRIFAIKVGQHITELRKLKNIDKYFDSSIRFKKNISLKLFESIDKSIIKRHDLIFTPIFENTELKGVIVVFQELLAKNKELEHKNANKELEEQRNFALKQIDEIEAQKSELELAFKKSSKHHIMLQKALRKIEIQKNELESALETINQQKIELERANLEIRESSRLKEIFLANTSHEIRTPLNAIIGFTNLLLSTQLADSQTKYLENIKASGNNLLVVINDILDFSKIESGKLTLEQIEFDIRNLISHTVNTLTVKSQEKNIQINLEIAPDIPEIIMGDPVRLNQILMNLLGNAIKFTNPGGYVRLLATKGKVNEDKIKILFKVEDNGIGIPQNKLHNIFQSFTQGESDTTRKYGGTGLGLSIVKQLIELQDGEIDVESSVGKGTAFTFYIMMKIGEKEAITPNAQTRADNSAASQMHILLVEDNLINQQLAFDTIKAWNHQIKIDVAENGRIALEKIENGQYNLVLMDIQMPEMDGIEATKQIRKLPTEKRKTPIVAMTAHALKNEKDNCISIGMNDYISKPFDPDDLFTKILKYADLTTIADSKLIHSENQPAKPIELNDFHYFNTVNLVKIYQNNHDKIAKIVKMCHESIPNELTEIQNSFDNEAWEILRNKAHSLKPKLGYLGMLGMQENAKNIEILSQKAITNDPNILHLINEIKCHWTKATPEIETYLHHHSNE
jgi:signal transduction histidine kinase/CheY-like chemotaxis protein/HPt (histidine-containing phosphotransfer) domain-containing protein